MYVKKDIKIMDLKKIITIFNNNDKKKNLKKAMTYSVIIFG